MDIICILVILFFLNSMFLLKFESFLKLSKKDLTCNLFFRYLVLKCHLILIESLLCNTKYLLLSVISFGPYKILRRGTLSLLPHGSWGLESKSKCKATAGKGANWAGRGFPRGGVELRTSSYPLLPPCSRENTPSAPLPLCGGQRWIKWFYLER